MTRRASELYFEELGDKFTAYMSDYDVSRRLVLIEELLPQPASYRETLEVGCGTGAISQRLLRLTERLVVSDLSASLAEKVGTQLGCEWSEEDACRLGFSDGRFELVVSSECIEHTPDPLQAVTEMVRVMAPGGRLVLTTPNRLWFPVVWGAARLGVRRFHGNEVWVTPKTVERHLRGLGCKVEQISGCHLFPWQIPGSKPLLRRLDRWGHLLYPLMINFGVAATKTSRPS